MALDGKIVIGTRVDEKGLNTGLKSVESSLEGFKRTITRLGIGTAVFASMKKAVTGFADFQSGIAKASSLFGGVEVNMDSLEKQMISLSNASGIAADSLNEGLYQALSAGVPVTEDMSEATEFLEKAARLSVAGFTDLPTAIEATAKTLNAYGYGIEQAERIQNILIETQNKGITTVDELGAALSNVTPIASSFGLSFEEVGASLALLTAQGVPTAQATTQLRAIISELGKDGTQAAKALAEAARSEGWSEKSFKEMMESGRSLGEILEIMGAHAESSGVSLLDLFSSIEAGQAALAIGSNLEKYNDNLMTMEAAAGSVSTAYDTMDTTVSRSLERIGNSFSNIMLGIGKSSEGLVSDIVGFVEEATTGLADAFGANGLQGAVQFFVDSLDSFLPRVFNWGLEIIENLANSILENLPKVLKTLYTSFGNLLESVFNRAEKVYNIGSTLLSNLWDGISSAAPIFFEAVGKLFGMISAIWDRIDWKELGIDLLKKLWEGIKATFSWFGKQFEKLGNWLLDKLSFGLLGKKEGEAFMDEFLDSAEIESVDSMEDLVAAINAGFSKVSEDAEKTGEDMLDAFMEGFGSPEFSRKVEETVEEPIVKGIELGASTVEESAKPIIETVGKVTDKVKGIGEAAETSMEIMQEGMDSFMSTWSNCFESITSGEDAWSVFARAGLNAIAKIVEALGHELAANAVSKYLKFDYAGSAKATAGSLAAYAAAGLIRGWAGAFATGGIVRGQYTGGDNLTASVKAGELILNHAQTQNVAKLLTALEKSSQTGGGLVIAFNAPVYGDEERIATTVYDKIKSLQSEGRLNRW